MAFPAVHLVLCLFSALRASRPTTLSNAEAAGQDGLDWLQAVMGHLSSPHDMPVKIIWRLSTFHKKEPLACRVRDPAGSNPLVAATPQDLMSPVRKTKWLDCRSLEDLSSYALVPSCHQAYTHDMHMPTIVVMPVPKEAHHSSAFSYPALVQETPLHSKRGGGGEGTVTFTFPNLQKSSILSFSCVLPWMLSILTHTHLVRLSTSSVPKCVWSMGIGKCFCQWEIVFHA